MAKIKNVIFDLGGVLLDIDYQKPIEEFKKLGFKNFEDMYSQQAANHLFESLEIGEVAEHEFYAALIKKLDNKKPTNEQLKFAWNSILGNFRKTSIAYLLEIKKTMPVYLLSNTNIIHQKQFFTIFETEFGFALNNCFTKAYYSHEVNLRKPYKKIYEYVLSDANLNANETLFIDDSIVNIPQAIETGIQTHLLQKEELIETILPKLLMK